MSRDLFYYLLGLLSNNNYILLKIFVVTKLLANVITLRRHLSGHIPQEGGDVSDLDVGNFPELGSGLSYRLLNG